MKRIWSVFLMLSLLVVLGGCAQSKQQAGSKSHASSESVTSSHTQTSPAGWQKIVITINGKKLTAHLNGSSAAKAFARELPTTLSFRDYPGLPEKIADLGHGLPTKGMPSGHAGTRGSIGYWSPQQRIVFYWGTEEYYDGIHIIGHFDTNDYRTVVKNMGNNRHVKIEGGE
ncbi:cyclophilin-like fold protein [Levilactobacillus hammesii]|nr:cyclophilin-like fold protein [Levilactobacillus hammesii]